MIEDQIADLILCLDSTLDTVSTFLDMYEQVHVIQAKLPQSDTSSQFSAYGSDAVVFALKEKEKEVAYTRKKAEALLSKVQNTRTLVCYAQLSISIAADSSWLRSLRFWNAKVDTVSTSRYLRCKVLKGKRKMRLLQ